MSEKSVGSFSIALLSDLWAVSGLPLGNIFGLAAENYMQERRHEARDILLEAFERGDCEFDELDADPLISIFLRYGRAVEHGAANRNLRLMAQVIVGQKRNKALSGDAFNRWASILSDLTRDEILTAGKAYAFAIDINGNDDDAVNRFWKRFSPAMESSGYSQSSIFSLCASIARFGLLLPHSAWDGMIYYPSEWLFELCKLADLNVATDS